MMNVLDDKMVRAELRQAWEDSRPDAPDGHEEGGFILRDSQGDLTVERWSRGLKDQIVVPPHPGGRRGERLIVASFHTHPNTGSDYQQDPSLTDIRAVRDDIDLQHPEYEGEYVISKLMLYRIRSDGTVEGVAETKSLLIEP